MEQANTTEDIITVGLDGSPESLTASRWAAGEAGRRGFALRLLHASPRAGGEDRAAWARRLLGDVERDLRQRYPELSVHTDVVTEDAGTALLEAAARSRALVIGSRGFDRLPSFFLGATGLHVVARAQRPVILLRAVSEEEEPGPEGSEGRVIAGLGLTDHCDNLLDFAFRTAEGSGLPLRAVHGRSLPAQAYAPGGAVVPHIASGIRKDAQRELSDFLRPWCAKYPEVRVTGKVLLESPARAVVREAAGSDLLVVGRARKPVTALGPRVGPVAQAALHHAACPVAVVPHD